MDINNLAYDAGPTSFYTRTIRNVIDDHMSLLRYHPSNTVIPVTPKQVEHFKGDLYGLFAALEIPPQYHYCVRQMNELSSSLVVPEDLSEILVPDFSVVDLIRQASTMK